MCGLIRLPLDKVPPAAGPLSPNRRPQMALCVVCLINFLGLCRLTLPRNALPWIHTASTNRPVSVGHPKGARRGPIEICYLNLWITAFHASTHSKVHGPRVALTWTA